MYAYFLAQGSVGRPPALPVFCAFLEAAGGILHGISSITD